MLNEKHVPPTDEELDRWSYMHSEICGIAASNSVVEFNVLESMFQLLPTIPRLIAEVRRLRKQDEETPSEAEYVLGQWVQGRRHSLIRRYAVTENGHPVPGADGLLMFETPDNEREFHKEMRVLQDQYLQQLRKLREDD